MIRERCSCGAEIEIDSPDVEVDLHASWIEGHVCRPPFDGTPVGGTAQVEQAPDYIEPELHMGFRP